MTKKFSWEVEKTSLTLRVADGAKETTWKIRKSSDSETLREVFEEIQLALWEGKPMRETVRTVDEEELAAIQKAWEEKSSVSTEETSEEASMAALQAKVDALSTNAQWWDVEDDVYTTNLPLPDYDSGEISAASAS